MLDAQSLTKKRGQKKVCCSHIVTLLGVRWSFFFVACLDIKDVLLFHIFQEFVRPSFLYTSLIQKIYLCHSELCYTNWSLLFDDEHQSGVRHLLCSVPCQTVSCLNYSMTCILLQHYWRTFAIWLQWDHMAEWIGHWARDQKVWGLIPNAGYM